MASRKTLYPIDEKGEKNVIFSDSREKENKHILDYFDRHGIEWEKHKLETGDYMVEGKPETVIERKGSLTEMAHNLLTVDRSRFYSEVRRARDAGINLIILCEHGGIHGLEDVARWKPRFGRASGKKLADAIFKLEIGYGVPTFFCDPRSTGRRIVELLSGGTVDEEPVRDE